VLTAAHCAFNHRQRSWYSLLTFAPARYRSVSSDFVSRIVNPLGEARVTTATVLSAYAAANGSAQLNYDVAVLRLEHPLGQQAGWMGVNARCEPGRVVRYATAGYPYFLGEDSNVCAATTCDVRFENLAPGGVAGGRSNACSKRLLSHECDAVSGQSGSPMYEEGTLSVEAVLTGELSWPPLVNVATRVTPEMLSLFRRWMAQRPDQLQP